MRFANETAGFGDGTVRARRVLAVACVLGLVPVGLATGPAHAAQAEALVGVWEMVIDHGGQRVPATMTVEVRDGEVHGTWSVQGTVTAIERIVIEGTSVSFDHPLSTGGSGTLVHFEGTVEGDSIVGSCTDAEGGEHRCTGRRHTS